MWRGEGEKKTKVLHPCRLAHFSHVRLSPTIGPKNETHRRVWVPHNDGSRTKKNDIFQPATQTRKAPVCACAFFDAPLACAFFFDAEPAVGEPSLPALDTCALCAKPLAGAAPPSAAIRDRRRRPVPEHHPRSPSTVAGAGHHQGCCQSPSSALPLFRPLFPALSLNPLCPRTGAERS